MSTGENCEGFIQTRLSLSKQGKVPEFQEVVFSKYKSNKNSDVSHVNSKDVKSITKSKDERAHFMKKARYDIIKFGMTGFDVKKKEETEQALAISLGALPKKRKAVNYKDLKEQRKAQKELEKQHKDSVCVINRAPSTKTGYLKQSSKSTSTSKSSILDVYGKVNKKELKKKVK